MENEAPFAIPERWNLMLRKVQERVIVPGEDHPAARIWRASDLASLIASVAREHVAELTTTFPPAKEVIARMLAIGWLQPLPLHPAAGKSAPEIYLVSPDGSAVSPLELLQGYEPSGVLSYFGALEFHELTTQQAPYFHIGLLKDYPPRPPAAEAPPPAGPIGTPDKPATGRKPRDPLGTHRFDFQGLPCYTTTRDRTLIPGIQTRILGPRTWLRITTPEQTLLDTLLHPRRCGGEAVVFEAWETGSSRWNQKRMEQHLATIRRDDLERRLGAMLHLTGTQVTEPALLQRLEERRRSLARQPETGNEAPIPLLGGFIYHRLDPEWGVLIP